MNVQKDAARLKEMIRLSGGRRAVPVILDDGEVTIGYGGT